MGKQIQASRVKKPSPVAGPETVKFLRHWREIARKAADKFREDVKGDTTGYVARQFTYWENVTSGLGWAIYQAGQSRKSTK